MDRLTPALIALALALQSPSTSAQSIRAPETRVSEPKMKIKAPNQGRTFFSPRPTLEHRLYTSPIGAINCSTHQDTSRTLTAMCSYGQVMVDTVAQASALIKRDQAYIVGVADAESRWKHHSGSGMITRSSGNARGLMQVLPSTWEELRRSITNHMKLESKYRNDPASVDMHKLEQSRARYSPIIKLVGEHPKSDDLYNPVKNIRIGAAYLHLLNCDWKERFGRDASNEELLFTYNMGFAGFTNFYNRNPGNWKMRLSKESEAYLKNMHKGAEDFRRGL